jgi:hypothetical protein
MPDYQKMYGILFRAQTRAIELLQQAQLLTEELYISAEPDNVTLIDTIPSSGENDESGG